MIFNRYLPRMTCMMTLATLLAGCKLPGVHLLGDDEPAMTLAGGESQNVFFFTSDSSFETDIGLVGGSEYRLSITIFSNWADSYIAENENQEALNERGFSNELMPVALLGATRRSRSHQWFELMFSQSRCPRESLRGVSDLSYDEDSRSYRFTANCSGELTLYVNDTFGFYGNNMGAANIALTRLN